MEVLLLEDVKGIGRRMEVKKVSDGYARNFLIPRKLAAPADASHLKIKKEGEAQSKAKHASLEGTAQKLDSQEFAFTVKVGEKGEVFGGVSGEDIKKRLMKEGFEITEIELKKSLKEIGSHKVTIQLGEGIDAEVTVTLSAER